MELTTTDKPVDLYPEPQLDLAGKMKRKKAKAAAQFNIDPLIGYMLEEFTYLEDWDHPRIRNRARYKKMGFTDNQLTSARKKAMSIWNYIRFYNNWKDKVEYDNYRQYVAFKEEVEHMKEGTVNLIRMCQTL